VQYSALITYITLLELLIGGVVFTSSESSTELEQPFGINLDNYYERAYMKLTRPNKFRTNWPHNRTDGSHLYSLKITVQAAN
jgi:hypothetical protein